MSEDYDTSGSYGDDGGSGGAGYSERSSQSWFERMGKAFFGIIIGLVLIPVALFVIFWNEGRAVNTARALAEAGQNVKTVESGKVDPAYEGKLVHMTGDMKTDDTLKDETFGLEVKGMIRLNRLVEMFAWEEEVKSETKKKLGGGNETVKTPTYFQRWIGKDRYKDGSNFMQPSGHTNPPWPDSLGSADFSAKKVTLGAFTLPDNLVREYPGGDPLAVKEDDAKNLPEDLKKGFKVEAGDFFKGKGTVAAPKIGDVKVYYTVIKPGKASVLAEQSKDSFRAFQPKSSTDKIEMLSAGDKSAKEMIKAAEEANTMFTWILRVVGLVVVTIGIYLLFNPLVVLADVIPFLGNLTGIMLGIFSFLVALMLSFLTCSIGWIFYRPMIGIPLLIVAALGFFGMIYMIFALRGKGKAVPKERRP